MQIISKVHSLRNVATGDLLQKKYTLQFAFASKTTSCNGIDENSCADELIVSKIFTMTRPLIPSPYTLNCIKFSTVVFFWQ